MAYHLPCRWAGRLCPCTTDWGGALTENADNAFGAGDAEFIVVPHDVSIKSLSANGGAHTVVGAGRPTASGALTVASSAALTLSGNKGLEAASANVAANGTLILNGSTQSFRHVRLALTRRRYPTNTKNGVLNGNGLAISEFRLTLGGEPVAWDGATLNAPLAGSLYPGNQPQCAPSMIMDGTVATSSKWFWATDDATNLDCFITFDFDAGEGKAFTFDGYQLAMADVRYRHPTAWSVYGSDDGVTWTALDTRTYTDAEVQTVATNTWLDTYTFSGSTDCSARFVRWVITAINEDKNPDSVALAEFQLLRDGEPVSWGRSDIANLVTSSHTQAYGQGYNHADENVVDGVIGTLSKWYHQWDSGNPGQEFADAGEMSFLFDAGIDRTFTFNGYRLAMADVAKRNPRGWRLEISNSAAGPWTVVDSQTYTSDEAISWPTNSWMPYAYAVSAKALTLTDGGTATIGGTLAGNGKVEGTVAFQDGSTLEASTALSGGIIVADAVTAAGTVMVKVPASYVGDAVKLMGWNTPLSGSGTFAFASPETAPANRSLETRTGGLYLVKKVEEAGQPFYVPETQQGHGFVTETNKTYPNATLGYQTLVLYCENLAFPGVTMVDGTALDSSGTAITLTDAKKLAGTVTVSSGDLTLGLATDGTAALTGATIASGATPKIEGDWAGVSLPATGLGTLDLTPIKDGAGLAITIPEGAAAGSVSIVGQGDSGNLTLNGGTLAVTGGLAVEGAVDVSQAGGVNAGSVTVDSGTLTVEQGATLGVSGETTLVNGGQLIIKGQASTGTLTLPEGVQGGGLAVEGTLTVTEGATLPGSLRPIPALTGSGDATLTITPTEDELASGAITLPKPDGFKDTNIAVEGVGEVQVSDAGDGNVTLTWVELPASLNLNFGSNVKEIPDDETPYGVYPAAGAEWVDLPNASGNQALDLGLTANPTVTYASRGVGVRPTNIDPILSGSIDTATITVSNLPYGSYDVIVYFATSYKNGIFPPVKVNGTYYTWDAALQTGYPTTVDGPSFGQGGTATAELGVNAIRIDGLSGDTITLVSHKSFNKDGKYHRGCIAGIQIVRRVVLTVDGEANWGDLTAGLDPNTPIEVIVLPGGSITGDVDLSQREDVIIDLTGFDFSQGDQPFAGSLTVKDTTTILLPTNPDQYQPNEDGTVSAPVADDITGTPAIDAPGETAISGGTLTVGTVDEEGTVTGGTVDLPDAGSDVTVDGGSITVNGGTAEGTVVDVTGGSTVTGPATGEGTVNVSGATEGEGAITVGGNVDLGETRPSVTLPEGGNASITVTPTGDEAIKGEITLPGGFTEGNTPTVNIPGVSGDVSTAVDGNGDLFVTWTPDYPTLDGAGEGNALPPTIVVTATEEELKNGTVTLPVAPGTTLPDGAQIVIEDAEGNHVATVGGALAEDTLTAGFAVMNPLPGGGDVSDAVKDAIVEDAMGNGITGPFGVALTPNGKPAGNLDGATLEEALDIFEDLTPIVTEDAEGNKTLTYAFWFGIARFTLENGTWKVTAQAMDANAENKSAALAAGCAYTLRTNLPGASTPKVTAVDEANRGQGLVVLSVENAPALSSAEGLACEIDLFIEAPQATPAE